MLEHEPSLYEQLGGKDAINVGVDKFYEKVMADPRINYFFEGVDMKKQRAHQKAFMTFAFGGAPNYAGRSMREAHRHLVEEKGLSDEHFDAVKEDLESTLSEIGVPAHLLSQVMDIVESTRDDVLNR